MPDILAHPVADKDRNKASVAATMYSKGLAWEQGIDPVGELPDSC